MRFQIQYYIILAGFLFMVSAGCSTGLREPVEPSMSTPVVVTLTESSIIPPTPSTSADGSGGGVIAFVSWQNQNWHVFEMNADGTGSRQLTPNTRGGYEPVWSPDGARILFQDGGLWILDIRSGEVSRLKLDQANLSLSNEYIVKPSWSPDGEWIAFLNENGYVGDIYLVKPDGTNLTRLTFTNDISRDGDLVWSPDSTRIAFSADRNNRIDIYFLNVRDTLQSNATVTQVQVSNIPDATRSLVSSWSSDGSKLLFTSNQDGNNEIYQMNLDGGGQVNLTNSPASDFDASWSPDGTKIVFVSNRDGSNEIYMMDHDGTDLYRLTDNSRDDQLPVWHPQ